MLVCCEMESAEVSVSDDYHVVVLMDLEYRMIYNCVKNEVERDTDPIIIWIW